jgi:DsbC/DsbD-like thiol-disulfide interchange protein
MKLTSPLTLTLLALFLPLTALAQGTSPAIGVAPIGTVVVARGSKAQLHIDLQVNRGFHVNSNKPNDELLMPTVVHLNPPEGVLIMNIQYPQGEELALPFMGNEKLNVYSGQFTVSAEVRVPKSAALGTLRIHGDVKYQACDNRQCFPPKTTPLQFDVKVVRPAVKKKATFTPASPHIH